jgi:RHS repeat-associated protein
MYGWCWPIGGGTPDPEWPFEGIVQPSSLLMQTVEKSYVLDYTSANKDVILEKENDGLALKYNYGLEKVSAMISGPVYGPCNLYVNGKAKVFYHEDSMGSTEYISDDFGGNILSYINYDPWGIPTNKATVMLGLRDVDLVAEFTGHPFDHVLGMYFAEARMYDAGDRRFAAADPMFGDVADPTSLNPYVYVLDNPLKWVDPLGLEKAVVSLMGSNLSATVDTDSMDSVIEMLNVFTYADKRWFFGDEAWVYSFDKEKIFNINFREGMSVKDVFSTVGLSEGTAGNGHDEIYFIKVICLDGVAQYQVVGPELGSDAYNKMVSSAKLYTNNGVITESAIERVMKDVYAWKDIDSISDGNFKSLGEFFSALVVDSGQWLNMNVNVHYFRNILNRVPTNIEEIITNKDDWTLLGLDDSAYHMYGDGGEFNLKFVSNDGHYEAVFMPTNYDAVKNTANWWEDYSNWKLVGSETELEQANMGTYNFSLKVPVTKVENITHGLYDVYPYQFSGYGNTENMPYSKMKELGYTGLDEGKERFRNNLNAILSRLSFSWKVNH